MTFKIARFILLAFVLIVLANTALAEGDPVIGGGDVNCSGKIMGKNKISNPNFGQLDFDSHPSPYSDANKVTDLSIVGLAPGLAPADRKLAACVDLKGGAAVPLVADEYVVKGYAWNTNLGFFSFFCDAGFNQGVACGAFGYGTKIGAADGIGKRNLSGNAWNPSFGYIQFAGGGAFPYQVSADKDGKLSGWAWTEAKVWVDMTGVVIQIPGQKVVPPVVGVCGGKAFACVEVTADPEKGLDKVLSGTNGVGGISVGTDPDIRVANGVDEYKIGLYLRESDGVTPMNIANYNIGPITFTWSDTVKKTQDFNTTVGTTLDAEPNPLTKGGAILAKPIVANFPADFTEDPVGSGNYILKTTIKSYAPTTDMNISYTTSFKPNVPFQNEVFFASMSTANNQIPKVAEANRLKLSKIDVPVVDKVTLQPPVTFEGKAYSKIIYPNGKDGLFFHFRPAVEVNTLYSGNNKDSILGIRSVDISFKVGGFKNKDLADGGSANVDFNLDYDKAMTDQTCQANGEDIVGNGFVVNFASNNADKYSWKPGVNLYDFDLYAVAKLPEYDAMSTEDKANVAKPCMQAIGPSIYSVVTYNVAGHAIKYLSNHLPRTQTSIVNPVAVVQGNLYSSSAFSPSAVVETQETGVKSVNTVRDGIYENLAGKLPGVTLKKDLISGQNIKSCTLGDNAQCVGASPLSSMTVEGTKVLVYENTDVHINVSTYSDNQTLVVLNGNIFIDSDIYKPAPNTDKMQIISLRSYSDGCHKGNIYIKDTVRNINANVFTDCSVFSYKDGLGFDAVTGIPKWKDFNEKTDSLNKQLRWYGSIASHNTVGGYDLDKDLKDPKKYLFDGFQAWPLATITPEQRLIVQAYDLNYLRLFKLEIQTDELGRPMDQSCKKGLTLEEMLQINQYNAGEAVDPIYGDDGITECNGINPLEYFSADNPEGDLVAPISADTLAKGIDNAKDFDPIYVIFSPSTSPLLRN